MSDVCPRCGGREEDPESAGACGQCADFWKEKFHQEEFTSNWLRQKLGVLQGKYALQSELMASLIDDERTMRTNLTCVQARCTELLEENRAWRKRLSELLIYLETDIGSDIYKHFVHLAGKRTIEEEMGLE